MLDLLGLPPSADDVTLLRDDPGPDAWSRWIDRLLASPRFGERLAMVWLDAARYADTLSFIHISEGQFKRFRTNGTAFAPGIVVRG